MLISIPKSRNNEHTQLQGESQNNRSQARCMSPRVGCKSSRTRPTRTRPVHWDVEQRGQQKLELPGLRVGLWRRGRRSFAPWSAMIRPANVVSWLATQIHSGRVKTSMVVHMSTQRTSMSILVFASVRFNPFTGCVLTLSELSFPLVRITSSQRHVQKHLYGLDKNDVTLFGDQSSPRIIRSHPAQINRFPTRYLNPFSKPDLPPTIPHVSEQIDVG